MCSLQTVVVTFFALHRPCWQSAKHAQQWMTSLQTTVLPHLGHSPIGALSKVDILGAIGPVWVTHTDTAQRALQRLRRVVVWAAARDMRPDHRPAMWEEIRRALPPASRLKPSRRHHPACDHQDIAQVLLAIASSASSSAVKGALTFTVLTAARPGEVRQMRWQEIDWRHACWTIPAEHTKRRRAHRVPLSVQALALLKERQEQRTPSDLIFEAPSGRVLSGAGLLKALRSAGIDSSVHGLRSTMRDWAAEETNYPRQVCEAALAHQAALGETEGAYLRSDLFVRRRQLMQDWADYCMPPCISVAG